MPKLLEKSKRIKVKAGWKILNVGVMQRNRGASFKDDENDCLLLKISSIYLNLSELESQHYGLFICSSGSPAR